MQVGPFLKVFTLYNVCSVHQGMVSTSGVFSRSGGYDEYIGRIR